MKKIIVIAIMIFLTFGEAYASEKPCVQIPDFNITLNDVVFDNEKATYPLITYKDVTYFPMTYNLCRQLGIITSWDSEKGLYITGYKGEYKQGQDLGGHNRKGTKYAAAFPEYPIVLNGSKIDNSNEEYPVLTFRNITYFPLTWEYANDEFGWEILFDDETGLKIKSNSGELSFFLCERNDTYALLQSYQTFYSEEKKENGDIEYHNAGSERKEYKLDFFTNTLTYKGKVDTSERFIENNGDDVSELFDVEGNFLMYNKQKIADISNIEYKKGTKVYGRKWSFDKKDFIGVRLYYDTSIPAPYTPQVYYVFEETGGAVKKINKWESCNNLQQVYQIEDDFYLCSNYKHLTGRYGNALGTILKVDMNGKAEKLNERYKDYKNLQAIGVYNNKLYVLVTWFGDENTMHTGEVSAINDGFFCIDELGNLSKIHSFIDGDAFLAPNGTVYVISTNKICVIDLKSGKRIKPNM